MPLSNKLNTSASSSNWNTPMLNDEKITLDLGNPIFVLYLNTDGCSRQRGEEMIQQANRGFNIYSNITMWIVCSNVSKIECLYDGGIKNRKKELTDLIEQINKRVEVLSNSSSFDDFKMNIRDWRLDDLLK